MPRRRLLSYEVSRILLLLLLGASLAAVLGTGAALRRMHENHYLELSFARGVLWLLGLWTVPAVKLGLLLGGFLAAAFLAAPVLRRAAARLGPREGGSVLAVAVAITILTEQLQPQVDPPWDPHRTASVFVLGGTWCGLYWLWLRRRDRQPGGMLSLLLGSGLVLLPPVTLFQVFFLKQSGWAWLDYPEVRGAAAVAGGLALVTAALALLRARRDAPRLVVHGAWFLPLALLSAVPLASIALYRAGVGTEAAANPRNVLLIGVDTLRLDHTTLPGVPGTPRVITPRLDALARQGTVFSGAISQAPWTKPAFGSILTGQYPREHGATTFLRPLPLGDVTLAERLREAGYATGAVVSNYYLMQNSGFTQGFDVYDDSNALGHFAVTSADITDGACDFLAANEGKPWFLFVHYLDPHAEYQPHEEWDYADHYDGWLKRAPENYVSLLDNRHLLGPEDVQYLRDLYDEEISYTDREIGRLLDALRAHGLEEDTAVVFVSDHGEELMDHGFLGHTITLFEELIHVPMVVKLPGIAAPALVPEVVETRALFSTLLHYLGVGAAEDHEGSLLPVIGGQEAPEKFAFSEVWLPDVDENTGKKVRIACVRTPDWKLILDVGRGIEYQFDLARDPGEQRNLAPLVPPEGEALRPLLLAWLEDMQSHGDSGDSLELDAQTEDMLRSLGYLGGAPQH